MALLPFPIQLAKFDQSGIHLLPFMNFNELYESTYAQQLQYEPRKFVEFYDHNRILIEGQDVSKNSTIYDQVMHLTSDYAISLVHNKSYQKAKPVIEKSLILFQNHHIHKDSDLLSIKYYEVLIFNRAMTNYYSGNYQKAITDLETLNTRYPDDERFVNWLKAAKSYKLVKLENALFFVLAISILGSVFIDDTRSTLGFLLLVTETASLVAIAIITYIKWRRRKVRKKD